MPKGLFTGMGACDSPLSEGCQVRIALMISIGFLAALLQIVLALCNFGFLVELVSETVRPPQHLFKTAPPTSR
jgi:hypothetical protein